MNPDQLVASRGVRIATAALAILSVATIALAQRGESSNSGSLVLVVGIGLTAATILGLILSIRPVYTIWMKFARILNTIATTLLFGAVYLLAVPWIVVFVRISDPLKLRRRAARAETYWISRRREDDSPESFQRMG